MVVFGAAVTALASVLPACASGGAPLPGRPAVAEVAMREYRFDHGAIPRGRVVFRVRNAGRLFHRLSLIPLPPDLPPIQEQLRGNQRAVVFTQADVPDTPPGGTGTFAVDLSPGRYALVCFIVEPNGASHALQGMASEFRIE